MNKFFAPLKSADKFILILVGLLGAISILMLESTVYDDGIVLARPVLIQAVSYVLGFVLLIVIQHMDYRFFMGLEKFLYIAAVLLLIMVYVPGLGVEQYGSKAWINLGFTTLQPSEFVKILFVLIMAGYLSEHRDELNKFSGVVKAGLVAAPIILIVLKEDLGSALVYMVMWVFMVFFAGIDYKIFLKCILVTLAAIPVVYRFLDDYQKERIEAFLHPDNLSLSGNYQVWQSKVAIGSGGLQGKGFLNGTQTKLKFVPEQDTDFIFCTVGEEEGFLGSAAVLLLFLALVLRLIHLAERQPFMFGKVYGYCVLSIFLFHVFINVGMVLGLTPVIGIPLPFFSYGGSSLWGFTLLLFIFLRIDAGRNLVRT